MHSSYFILSVLQWDCMSFVFYVGMREKAPSLCCVWQTCFEELCVCVCVGDGWLKQPHLARVRLSGLWGWVWLHTCCALSNHHRHSRTMHHCLQTVQLTGFQHRHPASLCLEEHRKPLRWWWWWWWWWCSTSIVPTVFPLCLFESVLVAVVAYRRSRARWTWCGTRWCASWLQWASGTLPSWSSNCPRCTETWPLQRERGRFRTQAKWFFWWSLLNTLC